MAQDQDPAVGGNESAGTMNEAAASQERTEPAGKGKADSRVNTGPDADKVQVQPGHFSQIKRGEAVSRGSSNIGMLMNLDLPISVELGRIRMLVRDILELGPGAVVELDKFSGEPVDIYVNDKKFAEGEVVVVDQNFGVRITALVGPDERLGGLNQ